MTRAEALDDDIGLRGQLGEDRLALGAFMFSAIERLLRLT